jgi:4-amino-4-deoxy-L-arabinose transferase-like glycosyltransferase
VKRAHLWLIAVAAIAPRLVVLLHERGRILTAFTDKSDDFAQTFVHHGTFGFIPGEPSAYTQPLYGFFLIPIYWIFGRNWWAVGGAQTAVPTVPAFLVYPIGTRVSSRRASTIAAILSTLNPYLVWHDMHLNREVLDQLVAAALILCTLVAADRRSVKWATAAGLFGGLAVLGNVRLLFIPLICCAFLVGREQRTWAVVGVVLAGCVITLVPWVVRNKVSVGCYTLTTDTRALWKANNVNTYDTLEAGKWIDDVPPLPNEPPTPEFAGAYYKVYKKVLPVDECARMRVYRHLVFQFWRDHPGEKAKLAGQATEMLWNPQSYGQLHVPIAGLVDKLRKYAQPAFSIPLFLLGLLGAFLLPGGWRCSGRVARLPDAHRDGLRGATRYRVPWDFLIALAAAAAVWWLVDRRRHAT